MSMNKSSPLGISYLQFLQLAIVYCLFKIPDTFQQHSLFIITAWYCLKFTHDLLSVASSTQLVCNCPNRAVVDKQLSIAI